MKYRRLKIKKDRQILYYSRVRKAYLYDPEFNIQNYIGSYTSDDLFLAEKRYGISKENVFILNK